ncbi:MAG: DUF4358 domain-containing protein [Oscillospiraceae bacterium]|nr:DUF4358 domain-containing protein [Oscillospiraceae bacterium]
MKNKKMLLAVIAALIVLLLCGCFAEEENIEEINPDEFSYEMLDVSFLADEIYKNLDISDFTRESVSSVTDETTLTEQYYLDLDKVVAYDIRSAEGNYGVADIAIIRIEEGAANDVMDSLEMRKDDRINEFLNYDVYDSYEVALEAEIYQAGELVVMLMLSEDDKAAAKEIIDYYLP